jgi:hypothetical protein
MRGESKEKFLQAQNKVRIAIDAMRRANDGVSFENWYNLEMGYAVSQLARAATACLECIELCNAETVGENEGAPTEVVPPTGEPSNGKPKDKDAAEAVEDLVQADAVRLAPGASLAGGPFGEVLACGNCGSCRLTEITIRNGEQRVQYYRCDQCGKRFERSVAPR